MNQEELNEPTTISLPIETKEKLTQLKNDNYFNEGLDAVKFAVAYAIKNNQISPPISKTETIYNIGSFDPEKSLFYIVKEICPNWVAENKSVYKTIERLAVWGIDKLFDTAEKRGEIDFIEIFN